MKQAKIEGTYGTMYYVRDMKKAVAYYQSLGLTTRMESPDWTEFAVGDQALCLHITDPTEKPATTGGMLITQVSDIKALVASLKAKGVEFMGGIKEVHPGAFSTELRDPDGNVVSLYENTAG